MIDPDDRDWYDDGEVRFPQKTVPPAGNPSAMRPMAEKFAAAFGEAMSPYWSGAKPWPDITVRCCRHGVATCVGCGWKDGVKV